MTKKSYSIIACKVYWDIDSFIICIFFFPGTHHIYLMKDLPLSKCQVQTNVRSFCVAHTLSRNGGNNHSKSDWLLIFYPGSTNKITVFPGNYPYQNVLSKT